MVELKNEGHFYYKGKLKNSWLARFFLHHTGTVDVGTVYTPCCIRNVLELLENSHLCPIYNNTLEQKTISCLYSKHEHSTNTIILEKKGYLGSSTLDLQ